MATQPPPWAYGVDLDTARARLHALGIPAHQRPGYVFPPPHTADLYQRGDAGPTLTRESKRASVLVALLETAQDGLCVLLSRRSATLRSHGGQVCFPGGKNELGETDQQSAFREAQEEVGMMPMAPQVICELERLAQPSFKPPLIVTRRWWWRCGRPRSRRSRRLRTNATPSSTPRCGASSSAARGIATKHIPWVATCTW